MDQILEANAMQGRIDELLDAASYNRDRMARLESERDEALARYEAVADALGYVNHADGQGGRDVADPDTIIAAFRALERCADELREALDEREADMHMRIRAGYDKTVADCWRAKVAEVERERDEARAEVERLQTASVASVDRWMEFVSHFQRLVRSNMGTEAGKLAIGYFKRAAEAGNLDEAGPPTVTPRDAAASERAMLGLARSVVAAVRAQMDWKPESATEAMFYDYACQEMPGAFWCTVTDVYNAAQLLSDAITRLDHHRDGGG